jgi:integrase
LKLVRKVQVVDRGKSDLKALGYVRPALRLLGIKIGGWHDFRHTLGTTLRKHGWSAKVRADILGHSSLQVTDGVYDHSDQADFREALGAIASELL